MSGLQLDFSNLKLALDSLKVAIDKYLEDTQNEFVRDSVVQRFEYSYELSWKMLKRQLEQDAASPESIDQLSYKDLIRHGAEKGFITDPQAWFVFRHFRNMTSHTYNVSKAIEVARASIDFHGAAEELYQRLIASNDSSET